MRANDEAVNSVVLSVNTRRPPRRGRAPPRFRPPVAHRDARAQPRELIGQSVPVKFLEVDEEKNRLVMSNRLATDVVSGEGLGVGDVCKGVVRAVKPYERFVDVDESPAFSTSPRSPTTGSSPWRTCSRRATSSRCSS